MTRASAFLFEPAFKSGKTLQVDYPHIMEAIDQGFADGRQVGDMTAHIASAILTNTVESLTDFGRRARIEADVRAWSLQPNCNAIIQEEGRLGRIPVNVDAFQWRIKWALSYAAGLRQESVISQESEEIFRSEIFGALAGKSGEQRQSERLANLLHKGFGLPVFREGADEPLLPAALDSPDMPGLSGTETKVTPVRTITGIGLKCLDGGFITERRSLTQDELAKIPDDCESYTFVNLSEQSGEMASCIITQPGSLIWGSMHAFWWSLARTNVVVTDSKASSTRMTPTAFGRVFASARTMWDIAIKEAGSIDRMRDLIVPIRNAHLQVISQLKDKEESEAARLGLDIALAMILATQSGDPLLEQFAYERFKRFMWRPGEEPGEFHVHDQSASAAANPR